MVTPYILTLLAKIIKYTADILGSEPFIYMFSIYVILVGFGLFKKLVKI